MALELPKKFFLEPCLLFVFLKSFWPFSFLCLEQKELFLEPFSCVFVLVIFPSFAFNIGLGNCQEDFFLEPVSFFVFPWLFFFPVPLKLASGIAKKNFCSNPSRSFLWFSFPFSFSFFRFLFHFLFRFRFFFVTLFMSFFIFIFSLLFSCSFLFSISLCGFSYMFFFLSIFGVVSFQFSLLIWCILAFLFLILLRFVFDA